MALFHSVVRSARIEIMRRDCIANVSHELCTPLTVLCGFLETVRELKLDPRQSREYLDLMEEQCKRMQRIITDLLQLSTLESTAEPLADKRVDVAGMLTRIRAEAGVLSAGRHHIALEMKGGFDLLGAESEIASAFGNLASNAVRYTKPGGVVRLIWHASPAGAEFTVEDTGVGIERKHIPRLTERFYRVDRDHSRHSGGTGLGLAIVKDVLARHQATLEIKSEPGKGSRFRAKFPAHRVVAAGARSAAAEGRSRADAVGIAPGVRNVEPEIEMSPRPLGKIPFRDAADKIPIQALPLIVRQPTKEVAYEDQDRHSSH